MLKKIINRFHLILFVLSIALLCGVFYVLYFNPLIVSENRRELIKPYEFLGEADVKFADGTKMSYKMPAVIETDQPFIVELDLEDLGMIDNKTLTFVSKDLRLRCEVDDTIIFRYTLPHASTNYDDGNMMYFIDLPERIDKSVIRLYYENDKPYKTKFELNNIKVGQRINIISHYFFNENAFGILLVILMFVLAFSIFSIGGLAKNRLKIEYYFNYIAILCILVGLYILSKLTISYFVLYRYRVFLHVIAYTVPMLAPMVLLSAEMLRTSKKARPYLMVGIVLGAINLFVQHILTFMNRITLIMHVKYTYLVITFAIIISIYAIYITKEEDENKNKRMLFSIIPLFLGELVELILRLFNISSSLSPFFQICLFLFFIFQINEFFSFYIANRDKRLEAELYQKLAVQDNLTGLGNRLAFTKAKDILKKGDNKFYCIVFDVDNLKYINDTFGHKYGDEAIVKFAELLTSFLYDGKNELFRIGGDEFVVFYRSSAEGDLMHLLEALDFEYSSSALGKESGMSNYSVSYGSSYYDSSLDASLDEVLDRADKLMYNQKQQKGISRYRSKSSNSRGTTISPDITLST